MVDMDNTRGFSVKLIFLKANTNQSVKKKQCLQKKNTIFLSFSNNKNKIIAIYIFFKLLLTAYNHIFIKSVAFFS